ncbi:AAA family ATPase, partial [Pyruvatibacter mobilis]|uniref:AAA family ATPase n=1 Tax=Pyruvatibacter mobilis TaxID=1712261 RepID=UPI003BA8E547
MKRLVLNFCFVYFSPRALELQEGLEPNSDNENLEDVLQPLDEQDLLEASLTRVKGKGKSRGNCEASSGEEGEAPALRHDLAQDMFRLSAGIFLPEDRGGKKDPALRRVRERMEGAAGAVVDHERARKAAAASARRSQAAAVGGLGAAPGDASVAAREPLTAGKLLAWLHSEEVLRQTNAKQREFLELLVDRAMVEAGLLAPERSLRKTEDPLVWLLHGPPGAGKSHALHFARKLFDAVLNYAHGLDYEVVAFQGTNAADLGGKTIHTAFGFHRGAQSEGVKEDAAKRIAHWRWLIVDEISLTSADLLGQAEQRLRACVPSASPWKRDRSGADRPFAGINVIFTGDFQQLKPPGGYYLADVPRGVLEPPAPNKKARLSDAAVLAEHGRMLLWGGATQGVTELTERERCK